MGAPPPDKPGGQASRGGGGGSGKPPAINPSGLSTSCMDLVGLVIPPSVPSSEQEKSVEKETVLTEGNHADKKSVVDGKPVDDKKPSADVKGFEKPASQHGGNTGGHNNEASNGGNGSGLAGFGILNQNAFNSNRNITIGPGGHGVANAVSGGGSGGGFRILPPPKGSRSQGPRPQSGRRRPRRQSIMVAPQATPRVQMIPDSSDPLVFGAFANGSVAGRIPWTPGQDLLGDLEPNSLAKYVPLIPTRVAKHAGAAQGQKAVNNAPQAPPINRDRLGDLEPMHPADTYSPRTPSPFLRPADGSESQDSDGVGVYTPPSPCQPPGVDSGNQSARGTSLQTPPSPRLRPVADSTLQDPLTDNFQIQTSSAPGLAPVGDFQRPEASTHAYVSPYPFSDPVNDSEDMNRLARFIPLIPSPRVDRLGDLAEPKEDAGAGAGGNDKVADEDH